MSDDRAFSPSAQQNSPRHGRRDGDDRGERQGERRRRPQNKQDGPKREAILDLNQYKDTRIIVKFIGGRQITGTLKGFDQLMNLVLDDVEETLRDEHDDTVLTEDKRPLGFVVVRCTSLLTIAPVDGTHEIPNPFLAPEHQQ